MRRLSSRAVAVTVFSGAVVLAPALATAASARPTSSSPALLASSVLLRPSDFGTSWASESDPSSAASPICLSPGTNGAPAVAGEAMSWAFSQGSAGPYLQQYALAYSTATAARLVWISLTTGALVRCVTANLGSESIGDLRFKIAESQDHTISVPGVRAFGHELVATSSLAGQSSTLYLDLLLLQHGRRLTALSVTSLDTPPIPSTELSLERLIARRLRKIGSP